MIKVARHTEGDSRVAKEIPTFSQFDVANRSHVNNVTELAGYFARQLEYRVKRHDYTKLVEPYRSMFYRDLCATIEGQMDFFDGKWSKIHYEQMERHHLDRHCPEDVNMFDVIEMICDCVAAGMARSGEVYDVNIPADVLQKAVVNTVQLMKDVIEVVDPWGEDR